MNVKEKSWQEALDRAAGKWRADDTVGALRTLEEALASDPNQPFLRIQKYYMERAIEYRKGIPRIEMPTHKPGDPMVSVIMTTYNRNTWIRESIESMIAQTFTDWELVLVNDGGAEEAGKIASSYNDRRIRYIWAEHGGRSQAMNTCLRNSRGKYIGILDDDDIYYPEHLATLVVAMESHPEAPVAYSGSMTAYQRRNDKNIYEIYMKEENRRFKYDYDVEALRKRTLFPPVAALIKREFFERQGGFNESLLRSVDWEMWLRLSREGKFIRVPVIAGEYRFRDDGTNITTNVLYRREHFSNAVGTMYKGLLFDGESLRMWGGKRAIRALTGLLNYEPDMIDAISIRKMLDAPKPYHYFESLAKEFAREGDKLKERVALKAAIGLAPHEIRLWGKLLKGTKK